MIFTIAAKELKALFSSPLAWMILTIIQVLIGYTFLRRLDDFLQVQSQLVHVASPPGFTELVAVPMYATTAMLMLFAVPLLAMRSIAEERRNRTMILLTSAPISMTEIVLGKFAGLLAFMIMIIALVSLMPLTLAAATRLDYGLLASLLGGMVLLVAGFAAVSLYVSSLTAHPMAAALGAFSLLLAMVLMADTAGDSLRTRGWPVPAALAQVLSPLKNFEPLGKGLVDTHAIACAVLLTLLFLALTIRHLDAQRLRG